MSNRRLRQGFYIAGILAIACGAALPVAAQTKDRPPDWIADPRNGCKVWDPAPEAGESIRWSGPCKNGFADGKGVLEWMQNGKPTDRYEGEYRGGKRNGHGTVTYRNGQTVEGDWRDDELLQMAPNEIDFRLRR